MGTLGRGGGGAFSWYSGLLRGLRENDNRTLHCGAGRMRTVARHVVNTRHEFMLGLRGTSLSYVYKTCCQWRLVPCPHFYHLTDHLQQYLQQILINSFCCDIIVEVLYRSVSHNTLNFQFLRINVTLLHKFNIITDGIGHLYWENSCRCKLKPLCEGTRSHCWYRLFLCTSKLIFSVYFYGYTRWCPLWPKHVVYINNIELNKYVAIDVDILPSTLSPAASPLFYAVHYPVHCSSFSISVDFCKSFVG
jgi:hypothetical protein